jgi:hypothetical protein
LRDRRLGWLVSVRTALFIDWIVGAVTTLSMAVMDAAVANPGG